MSEWPAPKQLAVYDPPRIRAATGEDRGVSAVTELRALQEKLQRHGEELADEGVYVFGYPDAGKVFYFSFDPQRAEELLRRSLGADVAFAYMGASRRILRGHPFGSWLAVGLTLHVFYGLPHNGEEPGGCLLAEREDCVIVSLSIVDWLGAKTLAGGFRPSHETVTLKTELGERPVIDNFDNRARPHWTIAAATPLPRPQDL